MPDGWVRRDYSLVGDQGKLAVEHGLANAQWYASPIPRERLKALMKRSDGPAIRDTIIWFAAFAVTGGAGYLLWGTWWAVPAFLAYGVLYGSSTDSRWHECGHGTAFKTRWMNEVIYQIACFMVLREPTVWRWSHARHHTDTIIVGRDPEVVAPRPPDPARHFPDVLRHQASAVLHLEGRAPRGRQADGRGGDLYPQVGARQGLLDRARPYPDLCRLHRLGHLSSKHPAAHVCRPAVALWRLALRRLRP